ncbi:phosphate acyltransferase PlsX [Desulfovibrio inopinatus]|uniref:phosphate acyltransferase PlsX n=1 Tax=Desulfovibrio inopinatus TaxID=102109 RepID=UPI00040609EE|nr:phosphate acyltransferase PlsX [Desulfovibrio inopinatus]
MKPNSRPRIAVDAMGGDFGPRVVVQGAVAAAKTRAIDVILVGDKPAVEAELTRYDTRGATISVVHASEIAGMEEKPSETLRKKKDTSIQVCCNLVRTDDADGVVSAGNSGTTMLAAMFGIGRLKGVDRPGLATFMPTEADPVVLIDVGANVDCKPYHLMQFAVMADVLAKALLSRPNPEVALLSIGEEEGKGNMQVKEAFELFRASSLNFVGNIEGRDLFTGDVDIIVCDGFVGNVALKLAEGMASSLGRLLKGELRRGFFAKIGTTLALSALKRFSGLVDYAEYGGAPLLGLRGICMICHGASNAKAMTSAIDMAAQLVAHDAVNRIEEGLALNKDLEVIKKRPA